MFCRQSTETQLSIHGSSLRPQDSLIGELSVRGPYRVLLGKEGSNDAPRALTLKAEWPLISRLQLRSQPSGPL